MRNSYTNFMRDINRYTYKKLRKIRRMYLKWNALSLLLKVIVSSITGVFFAVLFPNLTGISLLGTIYIKMLNAVAPTFVFFSVISVIATHKNIIEDALKDVFKLYFISILIAVIISILINLMFPTKLILPNSTNFNTPENIRAVLDNLFLNIINSPIDVLTNENYIGILVVSILLGVSLRDASDTTKVFLTDIFNGVSKIVDWIISLTPYGVMGIVFSIVIQYSLKDIMLYSNLVLILIATVLIVAFITNPVIVRLTIKDNPYPLLIRCLKESSPTAFITRSSSANIPINLKLCQKLNINEEIYSVSIPLGATLNMAGTAITISTLALVGAYTFGIEINFILLLMVAIVSIFGSFTVAGVPNGTILIIPLICNFLKIPNEVATQIVAIGVIINIVQDSFETGLNSTSDVLLTAAVDIKYKLLNK